MSKTSIIRLTFSTLLGLVAGYVLVATPTAEARAPQGTDLRIFNDLVARANLDKAILADLEACLALLEAACPDICSEDGCSPFVCGEFEPGCNGNDACFCHGADNPAGSICTTGFSCALSTGDCASSSDCGPDETCMLDTCCGPGICVPNSAMGCPEGAASPTRSEGPTSVDAS
jgi:hypothetical protein